MLRKYLTEKNIAIISLLAFIMGMAGQTLNYFNSKLLQLLHSLLSPVSLWWLDSFNMVRGINVLTLLVYLLLLAGWVLYITSKYKESRVIRFVFSLILANKMTFLIEAVFMALFSSAFLLHIFDYLTFYLISFGWIYLSYSIIQYFNNNHELATEIVQNGETTDSYFVEATMWQRIFNSWADNLIVILLLSMVIGEMMHGFGPSNTILKVLRGLVGEAGAVFIILIFFRFVYYFFFEYLFNTTPGKLLTETRVVADDGIKPSVNTILKRTACRFIPAEAISFLVNHGWHDRISHTRVVKEEQKGGAGGNYIFFLPALLITGIGLAHFSVMFRNYMSNRELNIQAEQKMDEMRHKIDGLRTNDFLQLTPKSDAYYSNSKTVFLKAEKIGPAEADFSIVVLTGTKASKYWLEPQYLATKDTLRHINFSKQAIKDAISTDMFNSNSAIAGLKIGDIRYVVNGIETHFEPEISFSGYDKITDTSLGVGLLNANRYKGRVVEVKVLDGDMENTTPLPAVIDSYGESYTSRFKLSFSTKDKNTNFKFNMTVADSAGNKQIYEVAGTAQTRMSWVIKRIN
jgi:uncharacterized RDD family membrane protein YckC